MAGHLSDKNSTSVSPEDAFDFSEANVLWDSCDVEHGSGYQQRLVVKENICYIVAGIVINERSEVLMVQEAKPSCYGRWYLPAGRMEPNETIVEGVKREVLEEAGLEFEPISILCVEECGGCWVRIAVIGNAVGGKLKTTEEADEESLQAMWWNMEDDIPIRCKDIFPLIHLGLEWKSNADTRPPNLLPIEQGQSKLFMRLVIVKMGEGGNYNILLRKGPDDDCAKAWHVPTTRIHPQDRSFYKSIECLLDEAVETNEHNDLISQFKIIGVLSLEHSGKSYMDRDGLAISLLVHITSETLPLCLKPYYWLPNGEIPNKSLVTYSNHIKSNGSYIPLRSLKEKSR